VLFLNTIVHKLNMHVAADYRHYGKRCCILLTYYTKLGPVKMGNESRFQFQI